MMGRSSIGQSIGRSIGRDAIDRILSREEEILPSSGFAVSVMDVVRSEAAAPPPIPFPWKRALPGIIAAAFVLGLVIIAVVVGIVQAGKTTNSQLFIFTSPFASPSLPRLLHGGIESAVVWTLLALLFAFASVKFSMRVLSGAA
jgi:hypothetical protein